MIRPLVPNTDPLLHIEIPEFDFKSACIDPQQLARDLAETMMQNNGIGLSAPQIGYAHRAFVMLANPIIAVFNPRIVDTSSEELYLEEGCLSWPNLFVKVKRPRMIRARYTMPNGETVTKKFDGLTARIFQHEMDHLDGIVFLDRATLYHREKAYRDMKKGKKLRVRTEEGKEFDYGSVQGNGAAAGGAETEETGHGETVELIPGSSPESTVRSEGPWEHLTGGETENLGGTTT